MTFASSLRRAHPLLTACLALVLLVARPAPPPSLLRGEGSPTPPPSRGEGAGGNGPAVLVQLGPGGTAVSLQQTAAAWGLDRVEALDVAGLYRLGGPATLDMAGAVRALSAVPGVAYAEPDGHLQVTWIPNDPLYTRQWHLAAIHAPAAWDMTTGSRSIIVAMIDTGVAANHPDLAGQLVAGYNFVDNTTNPTDDNGHGTYTAGLVAAAINNDLGGSGVAPSVRIMPVKILDANGGGDIGNFALGIHWAVDHGARVINVSAGIEYASTSMHDAVVYAHNHGVVVVASAGNTPDGNPRYPGGFDEAIAVAATDRDDKIASFSSYGSYVDIAAPGVEILSTGVTAGQAGYQWASGTSSAAPLVAGAAALLLSARPGLSPDEVQSILEDTATDLGPTGWDIHYGAGLLQMRRALERVLPTPTPAPPTATRVPPTATPIPPTTAPAPPTATRVPPSPPAAATPTATAPPPAPAARVALVPGHALPGAALSVSGQGFVANEAVGLRMTGPEGTNHELGSAQAGGDGSFVTTITLPADLGPGTGMLFAEGAAGHALAQAPLIVDVAGAIPGPAPPSGPATGARIEGTIRGLPLDRVQIYLQLGTGVRDLHYGFTNVVGFYHFDNLTAGTYTIGLNARPDVVVPPPLTFTLDGRPGTVQMVDFLPTAALLSTPTPVAGGPAPVGTPDLGPLAPDAGTAFRDAADPGQAGVIYFAPVHHTLRGPFLAYWQTRGGLPIFGYPISEPFTEISATDGKPYVVQYFQRNRFEYHPENAPPYNVLLGLLGRDLTLGRVFPPALDTISGPTQFYFAQTNHLLRGSFLSYWQAHGGLPVFGYPISEEFPEVSPTDGQTYIVQYFERNRFEYHPEYAGTASEVLLGLLGVDIARSEHLIR